MSGLELHKNNVTSIEIYNEKMNCYCNLCNVINVSNDPVIVSCDKCFKLSQEITVDLTNDQQLKSFPALKKLIITNSNIENLYVFNDLVRLVLIRLNNLKTIYVNSIKLQQIIFKDCKDLKNFYNCSVYEDYNKNFVVESCPNFNKNATTQMEVHDVPNHSEFLKFISKTKKSKIKELSDRVEQLNKQLIEITNELKEVVSTLKN